MQVSRRMDEMRKCRSVEDTGRALCTGLLPNQERYMQCMAAHDIDVVDCKFKIEAEMKKCEEEIPCKVRAVGVRGRGALGSCW